jgi:hypothetical protein
MYTGLNGGNSAPDVNVGVVFCGNTTAEAKLLIDRVKSYTNLFIISAWNPVSLNQTLLEEVCDYAVSENLKVIVNMGFNSTRPGYSRNWFWNLTSIDEMKQRWTERWGNMFLGMYYNDEPGGIQLDGNWNGYFARLNSLVKNPLNYSSSFPSVYVDATHELYAIYLKMQKANGSTPADYDTEADFFVRNVIQRDAGFSSLKKAGFTTFTSDYVLYWFDYLGGYDTIFAECGWNCSLTEQIDLVKGAAHMQNKEWGVIMTWKYNMTPYLDNGPQIYNQMMTSYKAGANYIVLFNYPFLDGNDYGVMQDEHFLALERFWNDASKIKRTVANNAEVAFVMPRNYGWGMRQPADNIWGFWGPDDKSIPIGTSLGKLLTQYGEYMDIIYDDPNFPVAKGGYTKIYYWNQTI